MLDVKFFLQIRIDSLRTSQLGKQRLRLVVSQSLAAQYFCSQPSCGQQNPDQAGERQRICVSAIIESAAQKNTAAMMRWDISTRIDGKMGKPYDQFDLKAIWQERLPDPQAWHVIALTDCDWKLLRNSESTLRETCVVRPDENECRRRLSRARLVSARYRNNRSGCRRGRAD